MDRHQRRRELLRFLSQHGEASVDQLTLWLKTSPATVRRDINWLADGNQLVRMRSGAKHSGPKIGGFSSSHGEAEHGIEACAGAERAIARHAASMCTDGESIIIGGGTTTCRMAEFLTRNRLKILTNSFLLAQHLVQNSENEIFVPGGEIDRERSLILSPFEDDFTAQHHASKMFVSACAVSTFNFWLSCPVMIQAETRLLGRAEELVVMARSEIFTSNAGPMRCRLPQVNCLITDTGVSERNVRMLEQEGIRVVTVEPEKNFVHH